MKFLPGQSGNPNGKAPGTLNKRSREFIAVLEKHGFCPASALIECYTEAKKTYDNYGTIYAAIVEAKEARDREFGFSNVPPEDQAHKYLKIAADIAKDLSSYAYPKLKAIEQTKSDPTHGMTPEQKLEAMKQAVQMLELQIKAHGPGTV